MSEARALNSELIRHDSTCYDSNNDDDGNDDDDDVVMLKHFAFSLFEFFKGLKHSTGARFLCRFFERN